MPVEIRELVIQARVIDKPDHSEAPGNKPQPPKQPEKQGCADESDGPDSEKVASMVDLCIARVQEWILEKSMR